MEQNYGHEKKMPEVLVPRNKNKQNHVLFRISKLQTKHKIDNTNISAFFLILDQSNKCFSSSARKIVRQTI